MSIETIILLSACVITAALLIIFVPREKTRDAFVIFLFKQFITWVVGLVVVEFGLIEYPVRLFQNASKTSFEFEYFIYPAICVIFNLHYPAKRNLAGQFLHYFYYCTVMTLIEALCEKYTNIVKYTGWTWYLTWITLFLTFYASRQFSLWFFKFHKGAHA